MTAVSMEHRKYIVSSFVSWIRVIRNCYLCLSHNMQKTLVFDDEFISYVLGMHIFLESFSVQLLVNLVP